MKKSDFLLLASENAREKAWVSESRNVNILGTANSLFHRLVSKGKKKKKRKRCYAFVTQCPLVFASSNLQF